jgi:hypothetical protein
MNAFSIEALFACQMFEANRKQASSLPLSAAFFNICSALMYALDCNNLIPQFEYGLLFLKEPDLLYSSLKVFYKKNSKSTFVISV